MPFLDRRSPRLPRFDYESPGAYFITVVAHQRRCLFGTVASGLSRHNDGGQMVVTIWRSIPTRHPAVTVDDFVLMPNHLHGLLRFDARLRLREQVSIPTVVGAFKSLTTCQYIQSVRKHGWPSFDQHLWQRSYYDRVIRDEAELAAYRGYIATNPLRWALDREFPEDAT